MSEAARVQISSRSHSGEFTTIGSAVLRTTTHSNGLSSDLVDFHVRQPSRDVNEAALTRNRAEFATFSPPNVTLALEHVCDGLLLAVMVNGGLRTRLDDKEVPLHRPVSTPRSRASAARRSEPGVWAVLLSNCEGLTMRMGSNLLMISSCKRVFVSWVDRASAHGLSD